MTIPYWSSSGCHSPFLHNEPAIAISTIPVMESCAPCSFPIRLFLTLIRPVFVLYSGSFSSISRNFSNASFHCSSRAEDSRIIRVLTFFSAIIALHTTVFPKAVAAWRIPLSYFIIASSAGFCSSRNSPLKKTWICLPHWRSSLISHGIPASFIFPVNLSYTPLGISIYPLRWSFPRYIHWDVAKFDMPIAAFL